MAVFNYPLLDAGLAPRRDVPPANRRDLIAQMAQHLLREGVPSTEREAMRLLLAGPYRWGDVTALAGDALKAASRAS